MEAKKKDESKEDRDHRGTLGSRNPLNVLTTFFPPPQPFALPQAVLHSFFERGLSRYSQDHFTLAGYPEWVRGRYVQISEATKTHKDFLESAITSTGSERVRPCNHELCVNRFRFVLSPVSYDHYLVTVMSGVSSTKVQLWERSPPAPSPSHCILFTTGYAVPY